MIYQDLTRDGVYKWRLDKTRYPLQWNGYHLELDVYHGALTDLVIAELEFESTEESKRLSPPAWFGEEVTDDTCYKDSSLAVKQGRSHRPSLDRP